ncbi:cystathionine beta-l [Gonapodya prolifera JEL478]|uniref:Cystathionine beta-lyase n=1 Tax=Gonapodya prolifera (strain JEL478) TaxID=1344416 RepID=A0A139AZN9_GONPJ|nr:cystathionine beta-l [Gonapodya prolifera JEL478]|eukprot:KXS22208.1 cystathionine beta-l [Gonapodya prolifera JEL478]
MTSDAPAPVGLETRPSLPGTLFTEQAGGEVNAGLDLRAVPSYKSPLKIGRSNSVSVSSEATEGDSGARSDSEEGTVEGGGAMEKRGRFRPATECVLVESHPSVHDPYRASSTPLYITATFKQSSATEMGEYDYSRSGNPTRTQLELHLAKLMSAHRSFALSSGMSALDVITRLVRAGEEVVAGDDIYGGTQRLLTFLATHSAVTVHHCDTTKVSSVIPHLSPRTRLVLLETPTNPLLKIVDLRAIVAAVRQHAPSAVVVVDNTMMSPYLQRPLELGADIVYHSGTKYLSGHHDLMAGVVGVRSEDLARQIAFVVNATGCALPPFDCFLLMRGVKTLAVRMDRQQRNAGRIAAFLDGLRTADGSRVLPSVFYPGLPGHPGKEVHDAQSEGAGAVLSFTTGSVEKSTKVVEGTRIFGISVSFGCVNSLISMPCHMSHASIPAHLRAARALPEDLIRLCVGIEDVQDLIEDLEGALRAAGVI